MATTAGGIQIRYLKKRDLFFKFDGPLVLGPFYAAAAAVSFSVDARFQFAPFLLAGFLHAFLLLSQQWFVSLRCLIEFQNLKSKQGATHVFIADEESINTSKKDGEKSSSSIFSSSSKGAIAEIKRIDVTGRAIKGATTESEEMLKLRMMTFEYHSLCYEIIDDDEVEKPRIYACTASLPEAYPLGYFQKWKRLGWRVDEVTRATLRFGPNKLDVPIPTFYKLFQEHAVAPLFVFQIFSVCLWLLDEHPWSSLYTLAMLIFAEGAQVMMRIQTAKQLRGMRPPSQRVKVFRSSKWTEINSDDLVPLDVVSLSRKQNSPFSAANEPKKAPVSGAAAAEQHLASSSFCPADIVLVGGSVIVNEAMLTGESTPQMKESISTVDADDLLFKEGTGVPLNAFAEATDRSHSRCVVFGGTQIVQHTVDPEWKESDGAVGIVIRTGARTSQGELMRTIMHTLEPGNIGSQKEAYIFLLGLLVCAVGASAYVLYHGLADAKRDRWELILHCVMLITIVVPPELPITLSMAVNNAITTLRKSNIFCTDPARIPLGGMVTTVAFDKTGTLTSDEFIVEGIVHPFDDDSSLFAQSVQAPLLAPSSSQLVLAGCHALAMVTGNSGQSSQPELLGDAIEKVALRAINWTLLNDGKSSTPLGAASGTSLPVVTVLRRWAFSSSLKRMTTIVRVSGAKALGPLLSDSNSFVLCKGAPEVIEALLERAPKSYKSVHEKLSSGGSRVLALAFKPLQNGISDAAVNSLERHEAEKNMIFGGFLSVSSPLKTDSMRTVKELQESNHRVIMITGDAPLTALAVARMLNIGTSFDNNSSGKLSHQRTKIFEDVSEASSSISKILSSLQRADNSEHSTLGCVTGRFLEAFDRSHTAEETAQLCRQISIFARVSPSQKERVIQLLNDFCGEHTAMVGDGSNDTGALKRSNVGIAVISNPAAERQFDLTRLKAHQKWLNEIRTLQDDIKRHPHNSLQQRVAVLKLEAATKKKVFDEDELEALMASPAARTGGGILVDEPTEIVETQTQPQAVPQTLEERLKALEAELNAESSDGMINLGDASMAAPFTSKLPTAYSVVDILRQGRCTHVTTHQSFKIMAVSSLVSCYMYSVLFLKGVKLADEQHMAGGIIMSALNMLVSFAKPVAKLSKERPQLSSLTPGTLFSIIGQFVVHLTAMLLVNFYIAADPLAVKAALESSSTALLNATNGAAEAAATMSDDLMVTLSDTVAQLLQSKLAGDSAVGASPSPSPEPGIFNTTPFIPSKLVSAVFLVSTVSQACTYLVSYRGEPFMEPMTLNSYLGRTAMFVYFAAAIASLGLSDDLNRMLNIIPLDDWSERFSLCGLIFLDGLLCWLIETSFRGGGGAGARKK
jgi:manganese-transporting P-type ATPase